MSKRIKLEIVAAVFGCLVISGFTTRLEAQERCTNASLEGSYAFKVAGANVSNPYLPAVGPFAAVGRNTYDGNGQMKGVILVSLNGSIIPATYTGTYTVNANCTGVKSATLNIGLVVEFYFVIDDDRREIQMVVMKAGIPGSLVEGLTVSGSARKLVGDTGDR